MTDENDQVHFYLNDHLGSVRAVITVDTSGAIVRKDKYLYYCFGDADETVTNTDQPRRYTGKPFDEELDLALYYYGARYYDPDLGRFTQIDPLRGKYPGWSPYVYAAASPSTRRDVNGEYHIASRDIQVGPQYIEHSRQLPVYEVFVPVWDTPWRAIGKQIPFVGGVLRNRERNVSDYDALDGLGAFAADFGPDLATIMSLFLGKALTVFKAAGQASAAHSWATFIDGLFYMDDPKLIAAYEAKYGDRKWASKHELASALAQLSFQLYDEMWLHPANMHNHLKSSESSDGEFQIEEMGGGLRNSNSHRLTRTVVITESSSSE
jgi:RHS repeat-associated protein